LADIPEPHFEEYQSGFLVEFRKNIYTKIDLSEMVKKSTFDRIGKAGKGIVCQLP